MRVIQKGFRAHANISKLGVLHAAITARVVRAGDQEVVSVVMMRAVLGPSLMEQSVQLPQDLGAEDGIRGRVARHIEKMFGREFRGQRVFVEMLTGQNRGIFQLCNGGFRIAGGFRIRGRGMRAFVGAGRGWVGTRSNGMSAVPTPQFAGTVTEGWIAKSRTGTWAG